MESELLKQLAELNDKYLALKAENERLKAEINNILNEVKDEIVDKFDADPMVRKIGNMVINEIKRRITNP